MTDFISSIVASTTQVIVGHPFDTIKILIQNKLPAFSLQLKNYYRGSKFPLASAAILNSILFPIYERTTPYTNSPTISGFIGGLIVSPIIYCFDVGKIKQQIGKSVKFRDILYTKGKTMTTLRESIAFATYFGSYDWCKQQDIPVLIAGGFAGLLNWTVTYPIDVIKSRQMAQNIGIQSAISQGQLWKGYSVCALRAILVNAAIFYTYEVTKDLLDTWNDDDDGPPPSEPHPRNTHSNESQVYYDNHKLYLDCDNCDNCDICNDEDENDIYRKDDDYNQEDKYYDTPCNNHYLQSCCDYEEYYILHHYNQ